MHTQFTKPRAGTSATLATPSMQEIDRRIANARRAQSDDLRRMVVGAVSAIDRRFRHKFPTVG